MMKLTKTILTDLTYRINGAAIEVHKALGPGLLESVYHKCMKLELGLRGLSFISEMQVPVVYKGVLAISDLRCDFLIEDCIILELKTVEAIAPVHEAQVLTYMKLLNMPKGILINFNCANLYHEGQRTFVNEIFHQMSE